MDRLSTQPVGTVREPPKNEPPLHGIGCTGEHLQLRDDPVELFDDGTVALQGVYDGAVVPERACFLAVEPRPEAFAE